MSNKRSINTCSRCRALKLRCDRMKPSCGRCTQANVGCSFHTSVLTLAAGAELHDSGTESLREGLIRLDTELTPQSRKQPRHSVLLESRNATGAIDTTTVVKKRQRAHLSCKRCYRLKVKCDKELPCKRCRLSGWAKHCAYNHRPESDMPSSNIRSHTPKEDPNHLIASWHAQRRGATHWEELLSRVSTYLLLSQIAEKQPLNAIAA